MTNHKVIIINVTAQGQFTGALGRHNSCIAPISIDVKNVIQKPFERGYFSI